MSYSYKSLGLNGKTNATNFFGLCALRMGPDYRKWDRHPDKSIVLQKAHDEIFFETGPYRDGLKLRIDFLVQGEKQSRKTKNKRQCYQDTAVDAFCADVIGEVEFRKLLQAVRKELLARP